MAFTLPQGTPIDLLSRGLGNNIANYTQGLGYGGSMDAQGGDLQSLIQALGYSPQRVQEIWGGLGGSADARDNQMAVELSEHLRDKQMIDWLQSQGYQVGGVDTGLEWHQQLIGPDGKLAAQDIYNYNNDNKGVNQLGLATALLIGGAAALGGGLAGGAASGAGAASGTGTLGAGATGAGSLTTQGIGAAELAGLGLSNPAPLAMAPSIIGPGAATAGSAALASQLAAATPGITTAGIGAGELAGLGLSNPAPLQLAPSIMGPGAATAASAAAAAEALKTAGGSNGLLDAIKNSGVGKAVGTVADLVGGGGNLAAIVGGALGATQGGKTDTTSVDRKLDPRLDAMLYGDGGYMSQLQQQFNATKGGNADMTAGADMLRNLYQSPQFTQGYQDMRSVGQGLLGQGVAGNPFSGQVPSGLLGFQPVARGQMPTTGLLPIPTRRGSV